MKPFKQHLLEARKTAGLIVTDGNLILIGHATNLLKWDIPKGGLEENEDPIEACIREVKEETNINVKKTDLQSLGTHVYTGDREDKLLYLFLYKTDKLPPIDNLKCTSYFTDSRGEKILELDEFKYVRREELYDYLKPELTNIIWSEL